MRPNRDTPSYFERLKQSLTNASHLKVMIGDFNLTLDNSLDRLNTSTNNGKSQKIVKELCEISFT